jgi:hypothetical protein
MIQSNRRSPCPSATGARMERALRFLRSRPPSTLTFSTRATYALAAPAAP